MSWIFLAIVSYFLIAIVQVVDKYLLSSKAKNALVYVFYIGVLNSIAFIFWPLDFSLLNLGTVLIAFSAGTTFFLAVFLLYTSMIKGSVSRIVSVVGGISPIFVLVLSSFFLNERMPSLWLIAFAFLISGSILLALGKGIKLTLYLFASALFFALHFFFSKLVFLETTFLNGFIWIRTGVLFLSIFVFFFPSFRKVLAKNSLKMSKKLFLLFVSNKTLSAVAFVLLNYAIMLGPVAMINALQGVQYASVFILVLILSNFYPKIVKESFSAKIMFRKLLGILLVSAGVAILFIK